MMFKRESKRTFRFAEKCFSFENLQTFRFADYNVFEKFDRFSLGNVRQSERRCRAFSITYTKE